MSAPATFPSASPLRAAVFATTLALSTAAALSAQSGAQTRGSAEIFSTTTYHSLKSVKKHSDFRITWPLIVPGNFGGSWHTDLLCYDRITGDGSFYTGDGKGSLTLLRNVKNYFKGWDIIVPGNFGGSYHTDLMFYDRHTGKTEFYTSDGTGRLTFVKRYTLGDWDVIVPGNFGGSSHTDLFLYSHTRGQALLYFTDGKGGLIRKFYSNTMTKIADVVVPGRFDSDTYTDLLFYSRVTGDTKLYKTDGKGGLVYVRNQKLPKFWDVIVPLRDSSYTTSKLLFYDRNAGTAQLATTTSTGSILLQSPWTVSKRWFSITPGYFDGDTKMDVLCYDNTYKLRIHAIRCMDDDARRAALITPAEVQNWIDEANRVYSSAGLLFEFDPMADYEELPNTVINNMHDCKQSSNPVLCKQSADAAVAYAAQCLGKIVVFFRHGPSAIPAVKGMSSGMGNIVVMPGFRVTRTSRYFHDPKTPGHSTMVQNIALLAHELGHYLAIGHTFVDVGYKGFTDPHAAVLAYMKRWNLTTMSGLDGDLAGIADTPPDVHADYYRMKSWNPANRHREIRIRSVPDKIDFQFNTDRYNVMSYWPICDDYTRVTPDQRRRVREWLHQPHRIHLINGSGGTLTRFGTGCSAGYATPATHTAMGCPRPRQSVTYRLTWGARNQTAMFLLGATRYRFPLDLSSVGAPGCKLYGDQLFLIPLRTDRAGEASLTVTIPNLPGLGGLHGYSQFACTAPGANNWGIALTNAVDTKLGM